MLSAAILTISDKGSRGEREDRSSEVIKDGLSRLNSRLIKYDVVPDEADIIRDRLIEWADGGKIDVILTTGGTGLSQRDVTPEATMAAVDRLVPGLTEAMRSQTIPITPMAMLSRATAGVRGRCLIVNLPGNPKAAKECLEVVLGVIPHAVEIIKGEVTEHSQGLSG